MDRSIIIQFGDSSSYQVLAKISSTEPLIHSLERIIKQAYSNGIIPLEYELNKANVNVYHDDRLIENINIPLSRECFESNQPIKLTIRTPQTPLKLRLHYYDKKIRLRKYNPVIMDINVNPSRSLHEQLKERNFQENLQEHKWYGKSVQQVNQLVFYRRDRLIRKRVKPNKSLWEQDIRKSMDLNMSLRVWWELPPRLTYPPPFTGCSIFIIGILLIVLAATWWINRPPVYTIHFNAEMPFIIEDANTNTELMRIYHSPFEGEYKFESMGRSEILEIRVIRAGNPIYIDKLRLKGFKSRFLKSIRIQCELEKSCDTGRREIYFEAFHMEKAFPQSWDMILNGFSITLLDAHAYERQDGTARILNLCPGEYRVSFVTMGIMSVDKIDSKEFIVYERLTLSEPETYNIRIDDIAASDSTYLKMDFIY